jgi:phosphoglycerate dehydrogenase-like enzyme
MVHDPVTPATLEGFSSLKAIVTRSTGFDHLPLDWLKERGIAAYALGGYSTRSVADLTVAMIVSLLYRVPEAMAQTQGAFRGGAEPGWLRGHLTGRALAEVTVGVLGTGRIGSHVVALLSAMGGRTIGYDIAPSATVNRIRGFRYVRSLDALFSGSDVLTLHIPLTDETRNMVDQHALRHLPPRALLVNTARGGVVDQPAVEAALRSGRLAGYAADLLPGEPTPPDLKRFRNMANVLLTPHLAAYNTQSNRARYETAARVAKAVLRSKAEAVKDLRIV